MVKLYNRIPDTSKPGRRHVGKPPSDRQNPKLIAEIYDADGSHWRLTLARLRIGSPQKPLETPLPMPGEERGWYSCKLHSTSPIAYRANYWLSLSPDKRMISRRWDERALEATRPTLNGAVLALLKGLQDDLDVDDAPLYIVRTVGESYTIETRETDVALATRKRRLAVGELWGALKDLAIGATLTTTEPVDVIKDALPSARVNWSAELSPLGLGIDVTRKA